MQNLAQRRGSCFFLARCCDSPTLSLILCGPSLPFLSRPSVRPSVVRPSLLSYARTHARTASAPYSASAREQVEILLWIKFFPQPLMNASSPAEVKLPWLATLSLFSLWGLLFVAVSEDSAAAAAAGGWSAAGTGSVAGGGVASASESMNSMGSLLDANAGDGSSSSSVGGGRGGEGEGEKEGVDSNGSGVTNADDAAVAGADGGAGDTKPRKRDRYVCV